MQTLLIRFNVAMIKVLRARLKASVYTWKEANS